MMFAVGVLGFNLSDPNIRYFDVDLVQNQVINDSPSIVKSINLEPCTIDHFSMTEKIKNNYEIMGASKRMCVPLNESFQIFGKLATNQWNYLQIRIKQCDPNLNISRPCANQSLLNNISAAFGGNFIANLYYVNALINPGSKNYIDY